MLIPLYSPPHQKKEKVTVTPPTLPFGPTSCTPSSPQSTEQTHRTPSSLNTARPGESQSPRRAWAAGRAQLRAQGPGERLGAGKRVLGRGLRSPVPALVSLCSQSHSKGAPQLGGTDALKKERKKKPPLARISGSQSSFCPKHRTDPLLALPPAFTHFPFVLGRTGSSAPLHWSWDTSKSSCRPLSQATLPWRALSPPSSRPRSRPAGAACRLWPSVGLR